MSSNELVPSPKLRRRSDDEPPRWTLTLLALTNDVRSFVNAWTTSPLLMVPLRPLPIYPSEVYAQILRELSADPCTPPPRCPLPLFRKSQRHHLHLPSSFDHDITLHKTVRMVDTLGAVNAHQGTTIRSLECARRNADLEGHDAKLETSALGLKSLIPNVLGPHPIFWSPCCKSSLVKKRNMSYCSATRL